MSEDKKYQPKYWNHKGKYEDEYQNLYKKLVPASGKAKTIHGEALRCIGKVYYDKYNNGCCNYSNFMEVFGFLYWVIDDVKDFLENEFLKEETNGRELIVWIESRIVSDEDFDQIVDAFVLYAMEGERDNKSS